MTLRIFCSHDGFISRPVAEKLCPGVAHRARQGTIVVVAANKAAAIAAGGVATHYPEELKLLRGADIFPNLQQMLDAGIIARDTPAVLAWRSLPSVGSLVAQVDPDGTPRIVAVFAQGPGFSRVVERFTTEEAHNA